MLNKKMYRSLLLVGILTTSVLAGCGTSSSSSSQSQASKQQIIKVAADTTFPPFESEKDGKVQGFDIDMINAIAKQENLKVELSTMQFTGLIPALQAQSVDVAVAGITIKKSRLNAVDFSNAYYKSGLSVLTKTNSPIQSVDDLKTKLVATKKGTSSVDLLKSKGIPEKNIKQFDNINDAYSALASGGAEAVVFDNPVNLDYANSNKDVHVVGGLLTGEYYGIAVVKNNPELLKKINDGLKTIKANGEYKKLFAQYFGGDQSGAVQEELDPAKVALDDSKK
ncbi:basic amino acid ABC transporter substrate-binding protein [Neobacillus ginsengisoli]|uniref:Polar amino acid transport system substrate-binding protein/glutamine transport system substrate-binding protein n=1 Tax=Neobacillus ginsengisoli TaxID=904295 RepID=A0ABT9XWZ0_9BACI|nr:basic amino acid ABC transporter substrate-binding protein [Neobacillus ginsengisoli]MDQ0200090.1 polar amino acid transport system substrate-binding protein/glutamine transport system substrate-binding protein [Neobacillus ginsengisoli]